MTGYYKGVCKSGSHASSHFSSVNTGCFKNKVSIKLFNCDMFQEHLQISMAYFVVNMSKPGKQMDLQKQL